MINMSEEQYKQALAKAYDEGSRSQASFPAHMVGHEYARDIRKRGIESIFKDSTMTEEEKNRAPTLDDLIERNRGMIESCSIKIPGQPASQTKSDQEMIEYCREQIARYEDLKRMQEEMYARKAAREAGL